MVKVSGLKVIEPTEQVIGKVVKLVEGGFEIEEYYINEYNTYCNRKITNFSITPQTDTKRYWKAFKEELGKHVQFNATYIEENVAQLLVDLTND